MQERKVTVPAIHCGHCTQTIENELGQLEGVAAVSASPTSKEVTVRFDAPASWAQIAQLLEEIGFPAADA